MGIAWGWFNSKIELTFIFYIKREAIRHHAVYWFTVKFFRFHSDIFCKLVFWIELHYHNTRFQRCILYIFSSPWRNIRIENRQAFEFCPKSAIFNNQIADRAWSIKGQYPRVIRRHFAQYYYFTVSICSKIAKMFHKTTVSTIFNRLILKYQPFQWSWK